jgi:hypothetical protein
MSGRKLALIAKVAIPDHARRAAIALSSRLSASASFQHKPHYLESESDSDCSTRQSFAELLSLLRRSSS